MVVMHHGFMLKVVVVGPVVRSNFQVVLYGVFIFLRILLCHLLFFDTCYLVLLNAFFSPAKLFDAFLVKVMIAFEYLYLSDCI